MKIASFWVVLLGCAASSCGGRGDLEGGRLGDDSLELPDGGVGENQSEDPDAGGEASGGAAGTGGSPTSAAGGNGMGGSPAIGGGVATGGTFSTGVGGRPPTPMPSGGASSTGGSNDGVGGRPIVPMPAGGASSTGGNNGVGGSTPIPQGGSTSTGGAPEVGGAGGTGGAPEPPGCDVAASAGFGYCQRQTFCPDSYSQAYCYDNGDGRSSCSCEGGGESRQLTVSGVSTQDACEELEAECRNPTPFPDAPTCAIVGESLGEGYCSLDRDCERSVTQGAVTFSLSSRGGTSCSHDGQNWLCDCYEEQQTTSRGTRLDGALDNQGLCAISLDICDDGLAETTGPKTCELVNLSSSRSDCSIFEECTQEGKTLSGAVVFSRESVTAQCYRGTDPSNGSSDTWKCTCQDGNPTEDLVGTDGSKVCREAATACSE